MPVQTSAVDLSATPRGRQYKGRSMQSKHGRFQSPSNPDSQHYMPHQGLFDTERAVNLLDDFEHASSDFEDISTHRDEVNSPPTFESSELGLLTFYGSRERRPQPINWTQTPQSSPAQSIHTPVSDNGGSRPRNDWTPRSQILQPITNSSQPQNDLISLIQQQQGMLQKVLTQQKNMQEQQKLLMEKQEIFEKKLNSLEESTVSSGSDGHKKARVTRQLTVSSNYAVCVLPVIISVYIHSSTEFGSRSL